VPFYTHSKMRDPTSQIRLLRLHSDQGRMGGSLEVWDRDSVPPYNAISYTSGEPEAHYFLSIDYLCPCVFLPSNYLQAVQQAYLQRHFRRKSYWTTGLVRPRKPAIAASSRT
jgi:hypothetical protein